ncbi:MAG: Uxx-star family glutaredoxin-like (seleno)protein [bacterium]|nr:Uxx-star family glutaredoxin-like (seleno)protein [bacterium]
MPQVTIYTTPTCGFCHQAKAFFQEKNVEYTEYDVSTDVTKAEEMVRKTGQLGVPVIVIGEDVIIGFDQPRVASLLGIV